MVAYPSNIPLPTPQTTIEFSPPMDRSDMNEGFPEQRLRSSRLVWNVGITWNFTPDEYEAFYEWFLNDLKNGALPFTMGFEWGEGIEETEFEFVDGSVNVQNIGFFYRIVSANLITFHEPVLAADVDYYAVWGIPVENKLYATYGDLFSVSSDFDRITVPVVFDVLDPASVPSWFSITRNGVFTGTPPNNMRWVVGESLQPAGYDKAYGAVVKVLGGNPSISYSIVSGALPNGLTLDPSGRISGSVTSPIIFLSGGLPTGLESNGYSIQLKTFGGVSPISFAKTTGTLPPGVSLSSSGLLSGTFTAKATFKWITKEALNTAFVGRAYRADLKTFSGTKPISYAIHSGSLPSGLTLDTSTGIISGTPT
jgi:hypothetical protein